MLIDSGKTVIDSVETLINTSCLKTITAINQIKIAASLEIYINSFKLLLDGIKIPVGSVEIIVDCMNY